MAVKNSSSIINSVARLATQESVSNAVISGFYSGKPLRGGFDRFSVQNNKTYSSTEGQTPSLMSVMAPTGVVPEERRIHPDLESLGRCPSRMAARCDSYMMASSPYGNLCGHLMDTILTERYVSPVNGENRCCLNMAAWGVKNDKRFDDVPDDWRIADIGFVVGASQQWLSKCDCYETFP